MTVISQQLLTTYTYDDNGHMLSMTDALNKTATYAYDNAGNLTSETTRDGLLENVTYDGHGRELTETDYAANGTTIVNTYTFTYDGAGRMLTAADNASTDTFTYDQDGRLASLQEPFGVTLTFGYDSASNRTLMTDSLGGTTTSVYAGQGQLTSRQFTGNSATLRFDQTWTPTGQLAGVTRYSDLAGTTKVGLATYTYDIGGRLTGLIDQNGAGTMTLEQYTYSYDPGNRLTSEVDNGTTTTYSYDSANQLTVAGAATYGYDANGNRDINGSVVGTDDLLTKDSTWTYTYDNENNLIGKTKGAGLETWVYTYDDNDRMLTAKQTTNGTTVEMLATYTYDALGNRIEQDITTTGTVTTRFAYDDSGNLLAQLNSSNALTMRYVSPDGADQYEAQVTSAGVVTWMLTDHLGSVRAVMSATTGTETDRITYDAYGNITSESTPTAAPLPGFTGGIQDRNTAFVMLGLRYVNTQTGRFTTEDPSGLGPDINPNRYVGNAPTDGTDPSGQYLVTANHADAAYWVDKLKAAGIEPHAKMFDDGKWWLEVPESYAGKAKTVKQFPPWWNERMQEAITSPTLFVTVGQGPHDISWYEGRTLLPADQAQIDRVKAPQSPWGYLAQLAGWVRGAAEVHEEIQEFHHEQNGFEAPIEDRLVTSAIKKAAISVERPAKILDKYVPSEHPNGGSAFAMAAVANSTPVQVGVLQEQLSNYLQKELHKGVTKLQNKSVSPDFEEWWDATHPTPWKEFHQKLVEEANKLDPEMAELGEIAAPFIELVALEVWTLGAGAVYDALGSAVVGGLEEVPVLRLLFKEAGSEIGVADESVVGIKGLANGKTTAKFAEGSWEAEAASAAEEYRSYLGSPVSKLDKELIKKFLKGRGNIAIGDLTTGGSTTRVPAFSGDVDVTGFAPYVANENRVLPVGGHGVPNNTWIRDVDGEAKILERVLHMTNADSTGTLRVFFRYRCALLAKIPLPTLQNCDRELGLKYLMVKVVNLQLPQRRNSIPR